HKSCVRVFLGINFYSMP
ncbi:effector from type III secretion system family protein, partial [Chlamydia psittaci 06-1683]